MGDVRERLMDACLEHWPSSYGEIVDVLLAVPGIVVIELPTDLREQVEHASRVNLVDKGMPWPETYRQLADWVLSMPGVVIGTAL